MLIIAVHVIQAALPVLAEALSFAMALNLWKRSIFQKMGVGIPSAAPDDRSD